jgi:hypothetical protein
MGNNWPDFRNMTREEAISRLREMGDEKLSPLIRWISESSVLGGSYQEIRVTMAEAERRAVRKAKGEDVSSEPHELVKRIPKLPPIEPGEPAPFGVA